jgi:hypothetical protein
MRGSLPYVTAALGHASAMTTLNHYTHLFEERRLAPSVPMVDAIWAARAELPQSCLGEGSGQPTEGTASTLIGAGAGIS